MTANKVPQHVRLRPPRYLLRLNTLAGAVLTISACSGNGDSAGVIDHPTVTATTPGATVTATATADPVQAMILSQYDGFWRTLAPASQASITARATLLGQFAANPALGSILRGIATQRAQGHVFYGLNRPRPKVRSLGETQGVAVIDDCQNSSSAGVRDLASGADLTVGVARNHVVATMHLMPDKVWRVVFVTYPKSPC